MEEIENIKNELEEIKTARDNIKTALQNEGETVTNDIRTYADTIPNVNKVKTVNSVEADTNKNIQLDASKINLDDTAETKQTVKEVSDKIIDADKATIAFYVNDTGDNINISLSGKTVANNNYAIDTNNPKSGGANSFLRNYDKSILFNKVNNANGRIDLCVASENIVFDPQESGLTSTKIAPAIRELKGNIDNITVPEYSVKETTVTEGYSKTYSLTKDGAEVGVKINIPKDLVVNRGSVKVVETAGTPYEEAVIGDKYLDIELNDPTQDHIYIPVKELVDVYIAGDGIEIDTNNTIKSKNSNLVNGSKSGSIRTINANENVGVNSAAFGYNSEASGNYAVAEGGSTHATGAASHAEGSGTEASGMMSHSEGQFSKANGRCSHAEGCNTIAYGENQHAQGKFNIEDSRENYAHIVGNGTSDTARSNAHTIDWVGNGWFAGNIKVGGTGQDDTTAKQLATEEYVNNELDPVKVDIGLIQNTTGGIFHWDGKSSTANPNNIQLWNNILTKHLEQDVLIYTGGNGSTSDAAAVLPKNKVNLSTDGQKIIDIGYIGSRMSHNSSTTFINGQSIRITLTITNGKVTSINTVGNIGYTLGEYLHANYNYREPYMPKYDSSPATKKYVDDNSYNAISISQIISEDKEAGYEYVFGKYCDSVMIFLNGEKLIAKRNDSQTIEEYSYTENLLDGKIKSVTFTTDFTITTGDRIEAVLINPSDTATSSIEQDGE